MRVWPYTLSPWDDDCEDTHTSGQGVFGIETDAGAFGVLRTDRAPVKSSAARFLTASGGWTSIKTHTTSSEAPRDNEEIFAVASPSEKQASFHGSIPVQYAILVRSPRPKLQPVWLPVVFGAIAPGRHVVGTHTSSPRTAGTCRHQSFHATALR